jgi:hypothetical protein
LLLKVVFSLGARERKSFGEAYFGRGEFLQSKQLLGKIFHAALGEVEGATGRVGVDALVVDLHGREGVTVAVAGDVAGAADVVIAQRFPPDDRQRRLHGVDVLIHGADIRLVLEVDPCV